MAVFSNLIPLPEPIQNQSSVSSLKQRLDWGEPALTIIDVRPRVLFNITHIMGSISMPMDEPNNFAPNGALQPPFQKPIIGRQAILTYMGEECQGLKLIPERGRIESMDEGYTSIKLTGKVQTP
jgi:hypothetical protein